MFAAILRASFRVSSLAAELLPVSVTHDEAGVVVFLD